MKLTKDEVVLGCGNFELVKKSGIGRNETPWKGLEVVSTGLAKKHVVKVELEMAMLPDFDGKPVEYKYTGAYVSHGMRMQKDSLKETREFIEVLNEAVEFAEKINEYLKNN